MPRKLFVLLALLFALPAFADSSPNNFPDLKLSNATRVMVSDNARPARVENNLNIGFWKLWLTDSIDYDRSETQNWFQNEATGGADVLWGFGPAYQVTSRFDPSDDWAHKLWYGIAFRGAWKMGSVQIGDATRFFYSNSKTDFRVHQTLTLRFRRLSVTDRFIWDAGATHVTDNKVLALFNLNPYVAVVYERQDVSDHRSANRYGIQGTFAF